MQIKFKLIPGTAIDGIVKSLQESTTDPIIDIHIERGEVEVKYRPSFYAKSPNEAMREFQENCGVDCGNPLCLICHPKQGTVVVGVSAAPVPFVPQSSSALLISQSASPTPLDELVDQVKITGPKNIAGWVRSCFKPKRKDVIPEFGGYTDADLEWFGNDLPVIGCGCSLCRAAREYRGFGL